MEDYSTQLYAILNIFPIHTSSNKENQVSLGMMIVGAVPLLRGGLVIISGGIAAAAVIAAMLPGPLAVRTSLGPGTSVVQGLFIEVCSL